MEIKMYYTISENNVVNKTLNNEFTITNVVFKQQTNVLTPLLIINSDTTIFNYNYVYIPTLNKYYFITGVECLTNGNFIVKLRVDVLMTYKNDIPNFDVIINRGENVTHNNYIIDSENKVQNNNSVMTIAFPTTPLNKNMYFILTTVGAGTESEVVENGNS